MAERVWIVETGDYEQRYVSGVYSSPERAAEILRTAVYGPPHIVHWEPLQRDNADNYTLVGRFEAVAGKSTAHTGYFDIRAFELDELAE